MITAQAIVLMLASSLGWALLDLNRKLISSSAPAVSTALLLVVGQIPLFLVWSLASPPDPAVGWWPPPAYWLPALVVVALNLVANLAFMQSVRHAAMSRTVPLLSLTPVFATLVAIPIFGEWPTPAQALGIVAVVSSALVISRGASSSGGVGGFWHTLGQRGGLLMAVVALCWSVTPSLDKLSMHFVPAPIHALVVVSGCAVGLALMAWRWGQWGAVRSLLTERRALLLTVSAAALAAFAGGVQLLAFQVAPVGLVETVKRGVGASLALVFGSLLFREEVGWWRLGALLVMVAGVALVILA